MKRIKMSKLTVLWCLLSIIVCCHAEGENQPKKFRQEDVEIEGIPYTSPLLKSSSIHFAEHFDNLNEFKRKWVLSKAKKPDVSEDLAQYDGKWDLLQLERFPLKGDTGLVLTTESRHAAIAAKFNKPFVFDGKKKFVVQYVVTFQKTVDCGGAYLKLLTDGALRDLSQFNDKTPYTIMFGPDKCGGVAKMHFIIRHKNPINGTIIEKHCTKLKVDDNLYKDQEPHLLKLVIEPNNDFAFYINNEVQYQGNLLDDDTFSPPINPPKEIIDVHDAKPQDWDDRPKIPDPDAVKPEDWDEDEPNEVPDPNASKPDGWLDDEPLNIPDIEAVKPADWDDEMDGDWEPPMVENPVCKLAPGCGPWSPPMIENPKYKGKWKPPMIDNPDYKGKWIPKKIPNPDFYYDDAPLKNSPIGYIGFELWTLVNNMYFDDILVADNDAVSDEWTEKTWALKKKSIAAESVSFYKMFLEYTNNYPWLWAVYVLVLAVIVGIVGTCCLRLRKNKDDFEREILHKKTDDYLLPDDEFGGRGEPGQALNEDDLNDEIENAEGDDVNDQIEDSDPEEKQSKPSSEEEEQPPIPPAKSNKKKNAKKQQSKSDREDLPQDSQAAAGVPSSPRKRRPRRD